MTGFKKSCMGEYFTFTKLFEQNVSKIIMVLQINANDINNVSGVGPHSNNDSFHRDSLENVSSSFFCQNC